MDREYYSGSFGKLISRFASLGMMHFVALLLVAVAHAAALFFVWRLADGALIQLDRLPVDVPKAVWIRLALAVAGLASLFATSMWLLRVAHRRGHDRDVIRAIQYGDIPGRVQLELIEKILERDATSHRSAAVLPPRWDDSPVVAAGQWVLNRFRDGDAVVALPDRLAERHVLSALLSNENVEARVLRSGFEREAHD